MKKIGLMLALVLSACSDGGTTYTGHNTYEYFPLDGQRSWTYVADTDVAAPNVDYNLFVEKVGTRNANGTEIAELEYRNDNTGDLLYSMEWSSDSAGGVQLWSYAVQGGSSATFDDPLIFADYKMIVGASTTTSSNGVEITTTLTGLEDCTNYWTDNVWTCLHFTIDGSDDLPVVGDWWGAGSWGTTRFQNTFVDQEWVLATGQWSGSEGAE